MANERIEVIRKQMSELRSRQRRREEAVVVFAKSLPLTLRDVGLEHTAEELERLLGLLVAEQNAIAALLCKDPGLFIEAMFPPEEPPKEEQPK